MSTYFVDAIAVVCVTFTAAGAAASLFRGIMAARAKHRFKHLLAMRIGVDPELRRLSENIAHHVLSENEIILALRQMEANVALLSTTDRSLLEPGLTRNTPQGTEQFMREVLAKA